MLEQDIKQLEEVITNHLRMANESEGTYNAELHKNCIYGMELVLVAAGYKVTYNDDTAHIEKF